ncbi:MAG: tetratricopeptide repeat protein [SAR324 cluster bacterium]|nr:tetratricopeptide repeat protein [SAR324 cluster bacterium]
MPESPQDPEWLSSENQLKSFQVTYPFLTRLVQYDLAKHYIIESQFSDNSSSIVQALQAIQEAVKSDPKNDQYRLLLSLIYWYQDQKHLAKAESVIANASNPLNGIAWILYGMTIGKHLLDGEQFIRKGLIYYPFLKDETTPFSVYYRLYTTLKPWFFEKTVNDSSIKKNPYELGVEAFNNQQWEQAQNYFEESLKTENSLDVQLYLAKIKIERNLYHEALSQLTDLQKSNPQHDLIIYYLGYIQEQLGYFKEAETLYRQALEIARDNPQILFRLGTVLIKVGKLDDAQNIMEGVSKKYPDYPKIWWNLGILYMQKKAFSKAQVALEESLRRDPDNKKIQNLLNKAKQSQ